MEYPIINNVPGITNRNDDAESKLRHSTTQIDSHKSDFIIYTDGSATAGTTDGGFSAVITQGPASDPSVIDTIIGRGRPFTSSFEEEMAALSTALRWIDHNLVNSTVTICTDSKSLCDALTGCNNQVDSIRQLLTNMSSRVIIQWVPGHSNIPGNELADVAAKDATNLPPGVIQPISLSRVYKLINDTIKEPHIQHDRTREVYKSHRNSTCRSNHHTLR